MSKDSDPKTQRSRETLAAQALGWLDPATRGLVAPIYPSAAYARAPDGTYPGGHSYSRDQNPTFDQPEALLTRLEEGADSLLFASGMAAATTLFDAIDAQVRVIAPARMYWTVRLWLEQMAERGRIRLEFYDNAELSTLERQLEAPISTLVWAESPSNPLCDITDLAALVELCHARGARVAVDNTIPTPVLTRPLTLGADYVMHSATKQLNGHADVLAGALVTANADDDLWQRVRFERGSRGAVPGPFESWLLLRGMRTLFIRVRHSAVSALSIARFLASRSNVSRVYYPGLQDHPGHEIAAAQMNGGYGPMLSFRVHGGERAARRIAARLRLFKDATSLGGTESLVEHRAMVEGTGTQLPRDLLRLSIGLEEAEDLLADLEAALTD